MTALAKKPDGSLDYHAMLAAPKLVPGARVQISAAHLRNTGQFYGDPAPCHVGPFARGEILRMDEEYLPGKAVALVRWDNGREMHALLVNLWPCNVTEPA